MAALNERTGPLAGRLDLSRLGAFGHSMGGDAALEYCRASEDCRAAANLDGGIWGEVGRVGVERLTLLVLADHTDVRTPCEEHVKIGLYPSVEWCEAERAVMVNGWQTVYERGRPGYALMMRGAVHASFMDAPFLPLRPGSMLAGGMAAATIDSERAWRITRDALLAFFGAHLDGEPATFFGAPFPTDEAVLGPPRSLLLGEPSAGGHSRP